jgi:hypothetical protein
MQSKLFGKPEAKKEDDKEKSTRSTACKKKQVQIFNYSLIYNKIYL